MVQLTSRYAGSFESQFESDVARMVEVKTGAQFIEVLDRVIDDTLSSDYWTITLPNDLATSASRSPALSSYIAALNILDADALMGTGKVRSRLDPAIVAKKGIERHHLFPKGYLRSTMKITDTKQVNQIANMALVEWADNIAVSDDPPSTYWPAQVAARALPADVLDRQVHYHALPDSWTDMPYQEFLVARRKLMGEVVREAFAQLRSSTYSPQYPSPTAAAVSAAPPQLTPATAFESISELLEQELLAPGDVLMPADDTVDALATVLEDGRLDVEGQVYDTPSQAAVAVAGAAADGWHFWLADTSTGPKALAALSAPPAT